MKHQKWSILCVVSTALLGGSVFMYRSTFSDSQGSVHKKTSTHRIYQEKDGHVLGYEHIESHLPSYISQNSFGLCLRASEDLAAGSTVGTKDPIPTEKSYIAGHPSKEYRHVTLIGYKKDGSPQWGKVRGKYAFINHSCLPNCMVHDDHLTVLTTQQVLKGQELTIAYDRPIKGLPWDSTWNFECKCGTKECRIYIDSYRDI